ncbi:hypothetical protein CDD82_7372 [Ophiocordyceps australis]|uniref:Thioesterase domain-containing protein n=1 Tax=Ophiocordyceps australis TaxID=1399860 RepID=A0A2C5ZLQ3_9HYPO|nr:hypothetical protein CDD82_7372 [Ophiocordyceps australis]
MFTSFDSIVNDYLINHCGLVPPSSPQHPLVARTATDYFRAISYPAVADLGLRVERLGRSSVVFEVAIFERGVETACAVCDFVHVFVERTTGRPHANGMTAEMRAGLGRICNPMQQDRPSKM